MRLFGFGKDKDGVDTIELGVVVKEEEKSGSLSVEEENDIKVKFVKELDNIGYERAEILNYKLQGELELAREEAGKNRTPKNIRKLEIVSLKRFACAEWLRDYVFYNNIDTDED